MALFWMHHATLNSSEVGCYTNTKKKIEVIKCHFL
jgi:hypothetical protein